jgi:ribosomal protein L19
MKQKKPAVPNIQNSRQWLNSFFEFNRGDVLRVAYLCVLGLRVRRRIIFTGLCLFVTKESFCISNVHNGAAVTYTFRWPTPSIFSITRLKSYKFTQRTSRVFDRKLHLVFRTQSSDKIPERYGYDINPTE